MSRRPGRRRKTVPTQHAQEALRRIFVYEFMRPDDFAWGPSTCRESSTATMACSGTAAETLKIIPKVTMLCPPGIDRQPLPAPRGTSGRRL